MAPSREIEKLQRRWQENPLGLTFAPLAEAYRKEGMYEDALELLSIGLAQHPNYVPAHIVRGRCYVDTHTDAAAEEAFQRVTELDPENVIALKGLADLAEKGGRVNEAIARLERLLDFDRNNDDARGQVDRLRLAQAQARAQAESEALAAEVAALPAEPLSPEPLPPEVPVVDAPPVADVSLEAEAAAAEVAAADLPDSAADAGRAAVVDVSAADVEVITYRPLELVAAGDSEYQVADDAASLADPPTEPVAAVEPVDPPVMEPAVPAAIEPVAEDAGTSAVSVEASLDAPVEVAAAADLAGPAVVEPIAEPAMPEPVVAEPAVSPVADIAEPAPTLVDQAEEQPSAGPDHAREEAATDGSHDAGLEALPAAHFDEAVAADAPTVEAPAAEAPDHTDAAEQAEVPVAVDDTATPVGLETAPDSDDDTAFDVDALDPERDDAEAVAGFEAEPDLVVTETMAELFLRQGHRALALAVYTQLSERDQDNPRIRGAIEQLQAELRPGSSVGIPAYAAVLTGGQSVRAFFEHLLATTRPTAPERQGAGLSLGAVFGEDRGAPLASAPAEDRGPSYDEFFAEEQPPAELPKRPDREGAAVDAAAEDLEHFTSWLKGLKR
ncbi:MAG: tetratricopeptide repeat protein [Gemmatimonadales bacterium]